MSKRKYRQLSLDAKKKIAEIRYEELLANHKHFQEMLTRRPTWKKFIITKNKAGEELVLIRCQSAEKNGVNTNQCTHPARDNKLVCQHHDAKISKKAIELRSKLKEYGLYQGAKIKVLKEEMAELEAMPREKMYTLNDEVKLLVGVARKYLAHTTDEQIAKRPYTLIYIMQNILAMKEANHNMIHSPKVVFTREQVEYLFMKVRMAIMSVVKDPVMLEQIQSELQKIAIELKAEGWRM